ncbi:MAG: FixH family protein [Pseudohongiella sp.]|nr:FixH family protein [Pseudohongiella sp.]MDP2128905.1 FixH family protein [Pseudohongiella sp.]
MIYRQMVLVLLMFSANISAEEITVSGTDDIRMEISSQVSPIPLNQMHNWLITLRTPTGTALENALIRVDGGMPAHNHGLATSPQVTDYLGEGRYLVEGLRFHMPGDWLMQIQVEHNGRSYRAEAKFQLGTNLIQPFLNPQN